MQFSCFEPLFLQLCSEHLDQCLCLIHERAFFKLAQVPGYRFVTERLLPEISIGFTVVGSRCVAVIESWRLNGSNRWPN